MLVIILTDILAIAHFFEILTVSKLEVIGYRFSRDRLAVISGNTYYPYLRDVIVLAEKVRICLVYVGFSLKSTL